jgi:hypothetical protein
LWGGCSGIKPTFLRGTIAGVRGCFA